MFKKTAILILISQILIVGCKGWKYQDDNVVEEIVEEAIDMETGLDVDLTPSDPEKGFSPKSVAPFKKEEVV